MHSSIVYWILSYMVCEAASQQGKVAPTVDLGYVKLAGINNDTTHIHYYRGVRYALPPVGDRRWRKPVPIEDAGEYAWGEVVNASIRPPLCFQALPLPLFNSPDVFAGYLPEAPQGEDCLFVNVLKPANPVSHSLPVLVQFPGGGYTLGGPYMFPGDGIVQRSRGSIIFVNVQSRLGLFGFLAGKAIQQDGDLNTGLLDQHQALLWVKKYIRAFGGDPNRVTIWGGSAGGGSVALQLTAYGAQEAPPFSAAIAEYPWWTPMLNLSTQELQWNQALRAANCTDLACLRRLDTHTLGLINQGVENRSYPSSGYAYGQFYYAPVVDGTFVQDLPSQSFKTGRFHKVPLLVDHDKNEGYIFSNMSQASVTAEIQDATRLFPYAGDTFFSRLLRLYPRSAYNSTFWQRQTWFGDFIINCPTYYMATAMVDRSDHPVFKMIFAAGGGLHAASKTFLNADTAAFPQASNHTLAEIMTSYWLSFVKDNNPNPGKSEKALHWPSYGQKDLANEVSFSVLYIEDDDLYVVPDPDVGPKCNFFHGQSQVVRN